MSNEQRFEEEFRDSISTVDEKGKRVWVFPKKQKGKYFNRRSIVAYTLLTILFIGPFLKINGEPLLMLNILERKFVIFGQIFWPSDMFIFAIGLISFIVLVIVFTVVFGRLFCGWVCPQTVFMEMVFRRIEYLIDGDWTQQKKLDKMPWNGYKIRKRILKWGIFWLISFAIANTFLAYIIGIEELKAIIIDSPSNHIGGLIAIVLFTTVFFAVFTWFREQVCTTVCPYGRLQGVLLDKNSIVVAYDHERGEGRAKFKKNEDRKAEGKGDCIDCNQCVHVCPTGIDIRNGTQLECVNCTLCMDACDFMMDNVGLEKGLIKYASEDEISTKKPWKLTLRAKAYIVLMFAIVGLLATLILTRDAVETTIIRADGTTYQKIDDHTYSNIFKGSFMNKSNEDHTVTMEVLSGNATVEIVGGSFELPKGEIIRREFVVKMSNDNIEGPDTPVEIGIYSKGKLIEQETIDFAGPGF
ncbi:cytochrome c oxidase accessory protein CcoG [Paracrocinitomix mangrovi]|uniref:cytochrome c oxidase accessory protein CcoG n=1 Tax=Paracrocinitomix mangrovi TaxID=2862509 RepID=UPI001C8EA8BE|nr:cytochrome c oxidase accessory protein CcoG [Paracrocinitomix mangrovi]UKN01488.1 cytochrome c oxidase accessory protein CcoG [Paracrocinitomix mangrovi]